MSATIRDVAEKASVGVGTVSRVINNSPRVREVTRQRVLAAIAELDFTPNTNARRLSLGKTNAIGVIAPFFTTPSCIERLRGIEYTLAETDYDFMLFNVENIEQRNRQFRNVLRRERIDGLVIITLRPNEKDIARLRRENIPAVLVDQRHAHLSYLAIDDVHGGELATQHLIDLGHRKIAFISDYLDDPIQDPFKFTASRDRFLGYRNALEGAGIPFNPNYLKTGPHAKRYAKELAIELLNASNPPTAIFTASDTFAIGVLQAAKELNIRVPDQLSVVGYDDIEIAQYLNLTTVRQPLYESGKLAIHHLIKTINFPLSPIMQKDLEIKLTVRNTTAVPPVGRRWHQPQISTEEANSLS